MNLSGLLSQTAGRAAGLAADAGGVVLRRLQETRLPGAGAASVTDDDATAARRWRAVTVLRAAEEVGTPDAPPPPLDALAGRIAVRIATAPGGRGTELAARFREQSRPEDLGRLRAALREAKQRLETGEVLRVDPVPHGTRKPTPQGALLEGMTERAPEEGVL